MSIITGGHEGGSLYSENNNNNNNKNSIGGKEERGVLLVGKQEVVVENFHASNSLSSTTTLSNGSTTQQLVHPDHDQHSPPAKKKRNPPGNPDPSAEVIALSPNTLMARNRFMCEICNKGFQRDQNLQLHRRGHNLPWKLKQRNVNEAIRKRVYICPEAGCVHHNPARALGDLTGIKKHFCRKHGEKKWKCDKCSKKYAVQSDWKAHSKTCGTKEYKCECGTIFSRRDSFITHRAFCDAIAEENNKTTQQQQLGPISNNMGRHPNLQTQIISSRELISSLILNTMPPPPTLNDSDNDNNSKYQPNQPPPPPPPTDQSSPQDQVLIKHSTASIIPNRLILKNPPDHHHQQPLTNMFSSSSSGTTTLSLDHHFQNGTLNHYMSATALLQKAAQMGSATLGATSSAMAPSSFGLDDHHRGQYGHGLINVNNDSRSNASDNNIMGVFSGLIFDHGHNSNATTTNGSGNDVVLHGENCDMTVDFLGIGRSNDFHQQKVLGFNEFNGGIGHQGLQGLSQFEQHAGMGKHVWDV